ncbi:MAG: AEC family transporter [Candidatus Omnitrophota bacterium]|nr:MAG: AEC family transporter [Candidatus Omnitrophota bacterium]
MVSTIVKLSLIAALGFYLFRKKIIKEATLQFLTFFVVNFTVPSLIFSRIVEGFNPALKPHFWVFVVLSFLFFALGVILSGGSCFLVRPALRREFISLVSFQNCGYLPMNIAFFLLPFPQKDTFLLYVFFYILGFNILMWSIGSFLIFRHREDKFKMNTLLTPPVISIIISLLLVYLKCARFIPTFILAPVRMVGETSFVLSVIILGGWLAKDSLKNIYERLRILLGISLLKLVIVPALALLVIVNFKIYSLLGLFLIIEASMPSAMSLPIIAHWHRRQTEFISQGVFFTHIVGMCTIPLWIELFSKISGYSL